VEMTQDRPWVVWWRGSTGIRRWWRAATDKSAHTLCTQHNKKCIYSALFRERAIIAYDPEGRDFPEGRDTERRSGRERRRV